MDERPVLRIASDALADRDAGLYVADRPALCPERAHDFRLSAWADAQELPFARRLALLPRVALMTAHLGLALLRELPDVATREFPRDARRALRCESESAEPERLARASPPA